MLNYIFVSPLVDNIQSLIDGIEPTAKILILDTHSDPIEQISKALAEVSQEKLAIHLISHGSPGCLNLTQTELNLTNLDYYAPQIKNWGLSEKATLLLYGCNVAQGDAGIEFVEKLHQITGAKIAASSSLTGNTALGGNWNLEFNVGEVDTPLALSEVAKKAYTGVLATFEVTSTNSTGTGSLRQAILNANAVAGMDEINFTGSVFTDAIADVITLDGIELNITDPLIINGNGADKLTVSGVDYSRVFNVDDGSTTKIPVKINNLKITKGRGSFATPGGGIYNKEALEIKDSVISDSSGDDGNGIINLGTLSIKDSEISGNTGFSGGGISTIGGSTVIENCVIKDNEALVYGGGISNSSATVTINNSTILGNSGDLGGGMHNTGSTVTINNSTIASNVSTPHPNPYGYLGGGGGIMNMTSTLTVNNSTISGNSTGSKGGGIYAVMGTTIINNSTVSGNIAISGGGIYNLRILQVNNSTITLNKSNSGSGIVSQDNSPSLYTLAEISNSIVSNNFGAQDVHRKSAGGGISQNGFKSKGNNLIGQGTGLAAFNQPGDLTGVNDPKLEPLQNNGGTTFTHALLSNSPAIDAGNNSLIPSGIIYDQRGVGFSRITNTTVDIGAFESNFVPQPVGSLAFSGGSFTLNENGTPVNAVTIIRSGGGFGIISATVNLTDGSAIAPDDYDNAAILVTFASGETSKTLNIPIVDDSLFEDRETLNIALSNPTGGATLGTQQTAVLTILDDDEIPPPDEVSFVQANFTVNENGTPVNAVTITRSYPGGEAFNVVLNSANGSAIAPSDYNNAPITVSFASDETSKIVSVPIVNDSIYESNETINLFLSDVTGNALLGTQQTAILTVLDNDPLPASQIAFSGANYTVNENGTPVNAITLTRTGSSVGLVSVKLTPTNGTASALDYNNFPITVNFSTGQTTKTINLPIVDDAILEANETVNLTLSNPTGGSTLGTQKTATLTILDNEPLPVGELAFTKAAFTVNENGTPVSAVTVTRTGGSSGAVSVRLTPSNNTAISPGDFNAAPITVSFANTETAKVVTIPIVNDAIYEPNEAINLSLSNPTGGATLGTQQTAILNILNDDFPGTLAFTKTAFTVNENGTPVSAVTVTRTGGSSGAVTVKLTPSNNTAISPGDFNAAPITVSFANTETAKVVTIPIVNDAIYEPNETLNLSLSSPTGGATLGTQQTAILNILNDDFPRTLAFTKAAFTVDESGTPVSAVTVTRTGGSSGAVGVKLTPTNGTAISPGDFNAAPITVSFANTETAKVVTIPIVNDAIYEPNETLNLSLSSPTGGATLGTQQTAILNILNDDFPRTLAFTKAAFTVDEGGALVSGAVIVTRTGGTAGVDSVKITATNGTATAPADYNNAPIAFSFFPGEVSKVVMIPVVNDAIIEGNETINLTLSNPSGNIALGAQKTAVLTVLDNDTSNGLNQTGNAGNETLNGGAGNDTLDGNAGNDSLIGGIGNDSLIGGAGNDSLTGGLGIDRFVINSPSDKIDTISDFNITDDTILVNRLNFGGLSVGAISATAFFIGAAATSASHRFIYNKTTGALFYDSNGNGAGGQQQIFQLSTNLAMTNQDIVGF